MSKISISQKHGVNPAIPNCYFCGKAKNELVLAGRLKGDVEAPKGAVWDMGPCHECRDLMDQGIILISVKDGESEKVEKDRQRALANYERQSSWKRKKHPFHFMPDPYRTGGWCVITDDALKRAIDTPELQESILRVRWSFVPDAAWEALGLPRGEA